MSKESYSYLSDSELIDRFKEDHQNKWLGELLTRYSLMLLGVCMKYLKDENDAKDCVQQVYLKIIDQIKDYDIANFKSWLYVVAKNECLMRLRTKNHNKVEWQEAYHPTEDEALAKMRRVKKEELLNRLHKNIDRLKPEQQVCIRAFYLEKKSYAQIAQSTGYTLNQVKSFLQNGKRKLEIYMKEYNSENSV